MKKIIYKSLLVITWLAITLNLSATIYRVNNNPGVDADFTTFLDAHAAVANFDTLYFEGSVTSYGDITFSKPIIVIGTGYFLTQNLYTQANLNSSKFGAITFNAGSSGSVIMGLEVTSVITIKTANIFIKNNNTYNISISSSTSFSNIIISQNYIKSSYATSISNSGTSNITNVIISNNIITGDINLGGNISGIASNNIFNREIGVWNFTFTNNIQTGYQQALTNNLYYNNIGNIGQYPVGNGNQQNVNMTYVFVGATGNTTDSQWQLMTGSPAIGAGINGEDCGIFGGPTPYILSGMPPIPSIYQLIMPATGDQYNGIDVTVKAKSH